MLCPDCAHVHAVRVSPVTAARFRDGSQGLPAGHHASGRAWSPRLDRAHLSPTGQVGMGKGDWRGCAGKDPAASAPCALRTSPCRKVYMTGPEAACQCQRDSPATWASPLENTPPPPAPLKPSADGGPRRRLNLSFGEEGARKPSLSPRPDPQ